MASEAGGGTSSPRHTKRDDMSGQWYGSLSRYSGPAGVVQVESRVRRADRGERLTLPEHVLRLAQAEYERQHGHDQDYERMQERSGLGILEVVALLADYVDRLGGKPTPPRAAPVASDTGDAT